VKGDYNGHSKIWECYLDGNGKLSRTSRNLRMRRLGGWLMRLSKRRLRPGIYRHGQWIEFSGFLGFYFDLECGYRVVLGSK
jgi:hypothetical protein